MIVDNYTVEDPLIAQLIDKLTEADGSPTNKVQYLIDAARMLSATVAEIARAEGIQEAGL